MKNRKTWYPWCAIENRRARTIEDMRKLAEKKEVFALQLSMLIDGILLNGSIKKAINAKDVIAQERGKCQRNMLINALEMCQRS